MNKENGEVSNRYGLRNRERNNCAGEEEENKEKVKNKKRMMRERKVEIGRDNVLMRYMVRILKRIRKLTICRCQEN
jgi:hypothetical protein